MIVWHRIRDFQLMSLKLIASDLLISMPNAAKWESNICIPGEITRRKLTFTRRTTLYCSKANPGALALGHELEEKYGDA